ncbi:MAG: ribosomal L7Ae/L30e/S12e/Gadd45 family protein [Lachnospiraceae bacterium]|jgi:ribosomal protein L7Ae-like RNA K-turn-binding protein|nr:ribosomal L7Ae/L30e/S12e/Gadd45 family protein [Lachnospiraceae bacterium]
MQDRVLSMLGLAEKAGKIVSGGFSTEEAVRKRQAKLVILAGDAQKNTVKSFEDKCKYSRIPLRYYSTKEILGHAVGREDRSCMAVTDNGFAAVIMKLLDSGNEERGCNVENQNQ